MIRVIFASTMVLLSILTLLSPSIAADGIGPLKGQIVGEGQKVVVVFLHGDVSSGGPANYHEQLMRTVAGRAPMSTTIALLRPGYENGNGLKSPGTNHKRRDQYTTANNDLVAQTLKSIRAAYPKAKLIAAGHSGGAAQLGAVIGRYPGIVDTAILIACPCDIKKWRAKYRPFPRSEKQSAIKFANRISADTKVIAISGALDENTWPALAEAYVAKAKANGVDATLVPVSSGGHWDRQMEYVSLATMVTEAKAIQP